MDMDSRCVYAMWDMDATDRDVRRLVKGKTAAELMAISAGIVANPERTKTSARIFARAIAMRLEE